MQIFDPIHNFIPFTPIEEELLNHPFLVRLSHIYQCGPAFHVYPGVTHTRFSHSLGVMHVATMLFDTVASWVEDPFERQFLRQAVRLGALLHDVGHYPLSHTVELFLPKHEVQVRKTFDSKAFDLIFDKTAEHFKKKGADVKDLVRSIALGEPTDFPFLSQLIADPHFGADRIDYLLRDALYSGLSYGRIDLYQLVRSVKIGKEGRLTIAPSGLPSVEALLLARHWMHERLYQHPKVRAYAFHYAKVVETVLVQKKALEDIHVFMEINDHHIFALIPEFPGHQRAILDPNSRVRAIKLPMKELSKARKIQEQTQGVWIDLAPDFKTVPLQGGKVQLDAEQIFWVYTDLKEPFQEIGSPD
ncbi:MAG: HD domain-containing protein [Chlamydiae bacterium]|nr:HD domain-containing protein [Chlamydiota bacterium]